MTICTIRLHGNYHHHQHIVLQTIVSFAAGVILGNAAQDLPLHYIILGIAGLVALSLVLSLNSPKNSMPFTPAPIGFVLGFVLAKPAAAVASAILG